MNTLLVGNIMKNYPSFAKMYFKGLNVSVFEQSGLFIQFYWAELHEN